jgi:hypothetical protein
MLSIFAFIIIISLLAYYFSKKQVILRKLKKAALKPIARIQDKEYPKIIGQAKHVEDPLKAPISG